MKTAGKTALITGGAHRVGKAITLGLAQAGVNVAINYNTSSTAAEDTLAEARAFGVNGLAIKADIGDYRQVEAMIKTITAQFGGIDILVNNASLWLDTPFPTDDPADWHRVTNILINGAFYCANAVAPLMLEKGEGAIVNIIDLAAFEPWPGYMAHSVGKTALLGMNRQLALELAPNVRVNAVAPGPVMPPPDFDDEKIRRTANKTLLGRWGTPEDIAKAVLFFIQADYITGEALRVDGGQHIAYRKQEHG